MPLALDLLEQARFLSQRESGKPRQASLRRAVSAAYYALFHMLAEDAASQASPPAPTALRLRVQRSFQHATMKEAAKAFITAAKPARNWKAPAPLDQLLAGSPSPALESVAAAFIKLQDERHKADYDLTFQFDRSNVQALVREADEAFRNWAAIRGSDESRVFLAALAFWKHWMR
jgi:hypothetical protein